MRKALSFSIAVVIVSLLLAAGPTASAQVRFLVPLTLTDSLVTSTVWFGFLPSANFCIQTSDSINGHAEEFQPPPPPSGVFDARFVWPRSGSNSACFDQGTLVDIRPYTANTQRDTLRVKMQIGDGTIKKISWPSTVAGLFTGLTLRYFDTDLQQNVNVDMRTNTSAYFTSTDDPATLTFFSAGLTGAGVEPTITGIPKEFALEQNYPNPFNPSTTMRFSVPQSARTDIAVFDILGRKVATLASEVLAPGYYKVQWDGTNGRGVSVSSGVYFVRMISQTEKGESFSAMRKLMLMK